MKLRNNRKRSTSERVVQYKDVHKMRTISWLKEHYVVDKKAGNILKCKVYEEYTKMCDTEKMAPVNPAVFGKILHTAFPSVENVRLMRGNNGQCKYYYRHFGVRERPSRSVSADGINAITTQLSESCGLQSPVSNNKVSHRTNGSRSVFIKSEEIGNIAEEFTTTTTTTSSDTVALNDIENDDVSQLIKSLVGEDNIAPDHAWDNSSSSSSSLRRTKSGPCRTKPNPIATTPPTKRRASFVFADQNRAAYKQRSSSPDSFHFTSSSSSFSSSSPHSSRPSSPAKELFPQHVPVHSFPMTYQAPFPADTFWDMHTEFEGSILEACIEMGTLASYRIRDAIFAFWGTRVRQAFSLPPSSDLSQPVEPKVYSQYFDTDEFMQETIRRDKELYTRMVTCFSSYTAGPAGRVSTDLSFESFMTSFGSIFSEWLWRYIRDILPPHVVAAKMAAIDVFSKDLMDAVCWSSSQQQQQQQQHPQPQYPLYVQTLPQHHYQQQQQQQYCGPMHPSYFYKNSHSPMGSYTTTTAISTNNSILPSTIPYSPLAGLFEIPPSDYTSALLSSWPFENGDNDNLFASCPTS